MFFQKVLKGIAGWSRGQANRTFDNGIICNWWLDENPLPNEKIVQKLTESNLDWHLNHYDDIDPDENRPFREITPYISLTAGVVERDIFLQRNIVFDPFMTALRFATRDFTTTGHVFYAHVYTLGRQSIELAEFAEEVRELNIYKTTCPSTPKERSRQRSSSAPRKSKSGRSTTAPRQSEHSSQGANRSPQRHSPIHATRGRSFTATFAARWLNDEHAGA